MEIKGRNVNDILIEMLWRMRASGTVSQSRNGPVMVLPEPVMVTYTNPVERVLFWDKRDANPFFHLMECIWMMSGRNDLGYLRQFNKQIEQYAEEDGHFWGAYGFRWRMMFGFDQLQTIVGALRDDKYDRRQVLTMWSPQIDLGVKKKDLPCNTHIYFSGHSGSLDMTVCNRSNDVIWGAFGANAVHFSFLHEAMSGATRIPMGRYFQFSNNMHGYIQRDDWQKLTETLPVDALPFNYYEQNDHLVFPLMVDGIGDFCRQCQAFTDQKYSLVSNEFLLRVAKPMQEYYLARKTDGLANVDGLLHMPDCDWKKAAIEWVERRNERK